MQNNKFVKFTKQKGFYISLITGVIAVFAICMISGTMLGSNQGLEPEPDTGKISASIDDPAANDSQLAQSEDNGEKPAKEPANDPNTPTPDDQNDGSKDQADKKQPEATASPKPSEQTSDTTPEEETASVSSTQNGKSLSFKEDHGLLWPMEGDILMKYSMDSAVYFKTLAQYKCNPALLIAGDEGQPVYAAADCMISSIETNEETGLTITAAIGDEYELVYGNLKEGVLKEGDYVKEGQVIGYLETPTKYYVEEGTNLFFEVLQNDAPQDPMLLLR